MNIFSPCFRINLMILPDQQFHNTAISQVKRKRVCVCVCVWIAFITMQFCIGIPIIPYTTSWSDFEEVLSILLTSTDDEQCKSFPCCLDLVAFVDRKCSWLILWFWRLDQISSKLLFLQLLGPLPRSGWCKDLWHSWYNPRFTNSIKVCCTLATHQFHVIRGNGGEELIDGNTATLPWCALAGKIWEGFQAGKFIHDDEMNIWSRLTCK